MKYTIILLVCLSNALFTYACSCAGEKSFCNHIQSEYFVNSNGIVCIAEFTGNIAGDYDFSAVEMKLVDLLYGTIQPGNGNYLNTDSIFWILLGQSATCYEGSWIFNNAGDQFVMAPTYSPVFTFNGSSETGYSLFLCSHDVFSYKNPMIGPMINDFMFSPDAVWGIDTVTINQFSGLIDSCIDCVANLNLSGSHNLPSIYNASSTILSSADVNANLIYKANDRITLHNGFKTDPSINFGVRVEGCN